MQQIHSILRSICSFLPNVSFLTPFITWLQERDLRFWAMLLMALTCVMWITVSDLFDEKDKNTSSNTNSRKSEKSVKREEENLLSFSSQTKSSNEKRGSVVDFASQMASQAATETSSNSSPSSPASPSTPNPTLRGVKSPLVASPGSVGSVGLTPPPRKGPTTPFTEPQSREAKHAKIKADSITDPFVLIGWQINVINNNNTGPNGIGVVKSINRRLARTTRYEVLFPSTNETEWIKLKRGPKGYIDYDLVQKL